MSRYATAGTGPQPGREPVQVGGLFAAWGRRRRVDAEIRAAVAGRGALASLWRAACEGVNLCHRVRVPAGQTITVPEVVGTLAGDPVSLIVRLLPGQVPADVAAVASPDRAGDGRGPVAGHPRDDQHVVVHLLAEDPLEAPFLLTDPVPGDAHTSTLLGTAEDGRLIVASWAGRLHTVVQGYTGSGKSTWCYGQLVDAAHRPDVQVAGIDPSGLLFRPWPDHEWRLSGTGDLAAVEKVLDGLVAELDARVAALPADADMVTVTRDRPQLVVIMEDYAGLMATLAAADRKQSIRVRAAVSRLIGEGRKAAVTVILLVQRAEADIVGAFERSNCPMRITFGADSPESIRLLHPAAADPDDHLSAPAGVGLFTCPGVPLVRFRAGRVGDYADYCHRVHRAHQAVPS